MTLTRRLAVYCTAAGGISIAAHVGFMFCFFTHGLIGKYIYFPFLWLWLLPNRLIDPFMPEKLPRWLDGFSWPINCFISLFGWIVLGVLVAIVVQGILAIFRWNKG